MPPKRDIERLSGEDMKVQTKVHWNFRVKTTRCRQSACGGRTAMCGGGAEKSNSITESALAALVDWEANVLLSIKHQQLEIVLITIEDEEEQEEG